jgi:hypothetical protein
VQSLELDRYLRREALRGRSLARPYAALALGLAVRDVGPVNKAVAHTLAEVHRALVRGLQHGRGADDVLAASAVALGVAQATTGYGALLEIVGDRKRGARLRACCAVALAQMGRDTPAVREALGAAAQERVSPWVHGGAVRALALLAAPGTTEDLLRQLETTRSRYAVAVVAGALGRFGDPAAAPALVRVARDRIESMRVRVMAVVALGLIFDPEPKPSRVRLSTHANYPSRTAALTQIFNIM